MHPRDWVDAADKMSQVFGSVGTLAVGFAAVAAAALVVVWRALRHSEQEQTQQILSVVGGNTESHERNATAHRDSAAALRLLSDSMDRLAQSMRDTEEQRRHSLDLILQSRGPLLGAAARRRVRRARGR